jgi:branched-chain amino acid transport system ATP-binding protein
MLELEEINSYYDDSHIVFDLSMEVGENEVVALLGRNGAGKSTTLKTAAGVLHPRSGSIRLAGEPIHHLSSHQIARRGVQLVPEERRIFGGLSVEENLQIATLTAPRSWPLDRIYQVFPRLAERCHTDGRHLSGGEQQMLAIARALIRNPRLILLDEPFEGLGPRSYAPLWKSATSLWRKDRLWS